jgi:zinc transporter ZupT
MVVLIGIAAFCSTALGGWFALHFRDRLHLILGFSAGAVIGVAFFDLMPEALQFTGLPAATTMALMAFGFALYLALDRAIVLHRHHEEAGHEHSHSQRGAWGAGTLSLHSFLDGLGIGFAFKVSTAIGLMVAAAVLVHDFSDGINTVSMIVRNRGARSQVLRWLLADALAPLVGVIVTLFFSISERSLGIAVALFAGFFLYIGASDLLPESHHQHSRYWTTIATLAGMAVLFAAVRAAGV